MAEAQTVALEIARSGQLQETARLEEARQKQEDEARASTETAELYLLLPASYLLLTTYYILHPTLLGAC